MDEIITPSEVAELLKIHVKTVYRLARRHSRQLEWAAARRLNKQSVLELVAAKPTRGSKSDPPSQDSTQQ